MNRWYDNQQEMELAVKSLDKFLALIRARYEAGYNRNERLEQWIVLGRYFLDTCGNCMVAKKEAPKDELPYMPDVMQNEEAWKYIKRFSKDKDPMISFSMGDDLPETHTVCPVCKQGWTINTVADIVKHSGNKEFPLEEYVGKTLADVKEIFKQRTDGVYFMHSEIILRNDRFIDNSPRYPEPKDEYEKKLVKNPHGWMGKDEGITGDYIIQPGDHGYFCIWTYYHKACNRKNLATKEEHQFSEVFEKAGFKNIKMLPIPNGYCPCDSCAPWFEVTTDIAKGNIAIGWRKRVINIDWSNLWYVADIPPLFKDEDVTKDENSIHAWGIEKAIEYLTKIREAYTKKEKENEA